MKNQMMIVRTVSEWNEFRKTVDSSLGFVPTMGALHEGHLSLFKRSKAENGFTACSIFVNPTQFNDPKDIADYPRTFEADKELLEKVGIDCLFYPSVEELYPVQYAYRIEETQLSNQLCGVFRPGHFAGMLTVVMKLLNIAKATRAYFGEKDFQQFLLVKGMAESFFLQTEILPCPTVREANGLAMSSRNRRLDLKQRDLAAELFKGLKSTMPLSEIKTHLKLIGFEIEYLEEKYNRRFVAANLGGVRLIDNVEI